MRRPFAVLAFVFAAFSCVLSNVGLDVILMFSVPMLNALYPVAIVLVLMGLVHGFCDAHPQVWVWVGGVVAVQSVILRSAMRSLRARGCRLMCCRWQISALRGRRLLWWRL